MSAQEKKELITEPNAPVRLSAEPADVVAGRVGLDYEHSGFRAPTESVLTTDSLYLPALNQYGQARINMYPLDWSGAYSWDLHAGLNVNIGLSVFATFGNSAWRGTGFGRNISAMYAVPLTDKLSFAAGGWFSGMNWSHGTYHDAGLNAVLGYRFDEHWEGYIYGQKSLIDKRMPRPLYDLGRLGDRIGAAVRYNFNPSVSIQVSVERGSN